jgi:hypothetical protein
MDCPLAEDNFHDEHGHVLGLLLGIIISIWGTDLGTDGRII